MDPASEAAVLAAPTECKLTLSQTDSYCGESQSEVLSVRAINDGLFEVVLDGSSCPFYAEGGGQPSDNGTVQGLEVLSVINLEGPSEQGNIMVTLRESPAPVGSLVTCVVAWARRFDFMQQHTAQHLMSAIADRMLQAETVGWELGRETVAVDLACVEPPNAEMIRALEDSVNSEIRSARGVETKSFAATAFDDIPFKRGLPKNKAASLASLRVVIIDGLDANPCGGTHVRNLSELQAVKITGVEKNRGFVRLRFIAGGRVIQALGGCLQQEARLTSVLTFPPKQHAEVVEKLLGEKRTNLKDKVLWNSELAAVTSQLVMPVAGESYCTRHIPGADLAFLQALAEAVLLVTPGSIVFFSGDNSVAVPQAANALGIVQAQPPKQDKKKAKSSAAGVPVILSGVFVLYGPAELLSVIKDRIMTALDARGGGRPGKVQGTFDPLPSVFPDRIVSDILKVTTNTRI